ncbi:MAG: hypothetical protein STHCBS139747_006138 [Sporothrix thermara]
MSEEKKFDLSLLDSMGTIISDFTSVSRQRTYPAIDPKRAELSQAGRTVLITGGGTNIGKAIAEAFGIAHAKKVIIVSRNKAVLDEAAADLAAKAASINSPTTYVSRAVDQADNAAVVALWDSLAAEGTVIDVLVLNAALFSDPKPLHELPIDDLWAEFEVNVKGPLHLVQKFRAQEGFKNSPKAILNVTTSAIHMSQNAIARGRPSYMVSKGAATHAFQLMADTVPADECQIISFHPGMLYGPGWTAFGITKDMLPFDDLDLPGSFAVWATSPEARFMHGRYALVNWDVTELASGVNRKNLEADPEYLRLAMVGLREVSRDPFYKNN